MKSAIVSSLLFLLAMHIASAAEGIKQGLYRELETKRDPILTGNLALDLFVRHAGTGEMDDAPNFRLQAVDEPPDRKSPLLAGVLSSAVPGAGEFYSESYLKGALFFAAEVAAWVVAYRYNRKGDRQTDFFQNYADAHWNVVQYAQYIQDHFAAGTYNWKIPGREGAPPWLQVNWAELNRMERDVSQTAAAQYYSHILPLYGEQQYYELIGKYQQFYQGWDDADPSLSSYDQITQRLHSGYTNMIYYADERGKANDFYNVASTAIVVVLVNHLLSAVDAAWSASRYNKVKAEVGMKMQSTPLGVEVMPTATVRVRW